MQWIEQFISFLEVVIWPVIVLLILYLFKNSISGMLARIKGIEYKGLSVSIGRELEEVKEQAKSLKQIGLTITPAPAEVVASTKIRNRASIEDEIDTMLTDQSVKDLRSINSELMSLKNSVIAETNITRSFIVGILIKTWSFVEKSLSIFVVLSKLPLNETITIKSSIDSLLNRQLVSGAFSNSFHSLRRIRNTVVHTEGFEISKDELLMFIDFASGMTLYLVSKGLERAR